MDDEMTFSEEGMLDYDGTSGFDAGDMSAFDEGTLFSSQYNTDYAPSFNGSGGATGLTPNWLSVDTPGKYPRNDSSVTAIMSTATAGATAPKDVKPRSQQSSTSPDSSSQDSPASSQSSGRRKRKSPTSQDTATTDNTKVTATSQREGPPSLSPTYDPKKQAALRGKHMLADSMARQSVQTPEMVHHEQNVDNISSAMNHSNLFDFESAASSPGAFGNGISATAFDALNTTPRTLGLMQDTPKLASVETNPKAAKFFFESRENSPLTAMSASHHASPVAMFSNDSPGNMHTLTGDGTFWPAQARAPHFDFNTSTLMTPSPVADNMSVGMNSPMTTVSTGATLGQLPCQLNIRPFNNKSRVETQIPVVLTMSPMPSNVSRVHLQSHTISKPKLLAKEPQKSPDALELHAAVVCTSAMQKPHLKERALKRAAGIIEVPPVKREVRRASAGDADDENSDPNEPLNGGDVKICSNCVNRERKRAARKKAKKQEDEDHWSQFEQERIVVFNTSEYKDWQPVSKDGGHGDSQQHPEGAMFVEVPMRIACYCRHQSEKIGFQVIFTIKDWQDRVLAQNISDSILITDDHKTQPTVGGHAGIPSGDFNFGGLVSGYNSPELPSASFQQHRPYHSTNDLQALRSQFTQQAFPGMTSGHNDPNMMMQASSAAATPRNLSRPASPTFQAGASKRRKGSSVHVQIPANLRMTQRTQNNNNNIPTSMPGMNNAPMSAGAIMGSSDPSFAMTPLSAPQYQSQPPTPNSNTGFMSNSINRTASNDNIQMYQFYSTPHSQNPSRGPSRVPSPVMSRPTSRTIPPHQAPQNQMQTAMGGQGMHGMSFSPEAQQPPRPTLTRLNPREGPLAGNIQVDIHGTGFRPGINVYFGDKAAHYNIWNEGALFAIVPPGTTTGPVEVTIQDPNDAHGGFQMHARRDPFYFTYNDDREQQIWEVFGRTVFEKQFGHVDAKQASAMMNQSNGMVYGYGNPAMQMNFSQMQQMQQRQAQTLAAARAAGNTEDALLQLLSMIDMDDSEYAADFDKCYRNTKMTMLAMASGLGYTRLVAGLVARGATVDLRDKSGYTPLMLAAMRGYRQIVRLLARRGADPTIRNHVGYTAADLASSPDIVIELAQTAQHVRQRSIGGTPAFGSRANSVAFADNPYLTPARSSDASLITVSDDSEAVEEIDEFPIRLDAGLASRRSSLAQQQVSRRSSRRPSATIELPMQLSQEQQAAMMMSPLASMTAWHNQLLAQMNRLQQSVSDIQFAMPNIQDSMMVRRFSSMMPFSASTPPPPYEEKDPAKETSGVSGDEKAGVMTAAAEAALDDMCEQRFDFAAGVVTATATAAPRLGSRDVANGQILVDRDIQVSIGKKAISKEQQHQLRLAHQARLKSGRSDWKVWVIWLPLLIVVALLMTKNMLPQMSLSFGAVGHRLARFVPEGLLA